MEPQKLNNSNPSSPESDHNPLEKPKEDSATASATDGVGRSYECTFCKRGFTNAQALGGHMNIHRKDKDKAKAKAKAKQKNQEDLLIQNFKSNENYKNLSYFPDQISSTDCNLVFAGHVNYQLHLPLSNPGFQTGNDQYNRFPVWRPDHLKDQMDANPSLSIGLCPPVEDEEEVDLELRLGPYS